MAALPLRLVAGPAPTASRPPIVDINPRRDKALAEELRTEARRLKNLGFQLAEQVRYNERRRANASMAVSRTSSVVAMSGSVAPPR